LLTQKWKLTEQCTPAALKLHLQKLQQKRRQLKVAICQQRRLQQKAETSQLRRNASKISPRLERFLLFP
jgi:hypothetical protein